jgi:hypothetical protein
MKKLLLLLLIAPVLGFGQVLTDVLYLSGYNVNPSYSDTVSAQQNYSEFLTPRGIITNLDPLEDRVTMYTVPQGKLWRIKHTARAQTYANDNGVFENGSFEVYNLNLILDSPELGIFDKNFSRSSSFNSYQNPYRWGENISIETPFLSGGTKFWFDEFVYFAIVYEYSLDSNSLSYNEPETIQNNSNTPVLFPNPTSSLLALNSEKEYDIEVYDMAGNKVMALTGNNINMAHLSTATYIVKATDKSNNEELTYKVVKN